MEGFREGKGEHAAGSEPLLLGMGGDLNKTNQGGSQKI